MKKGRLSLQSIIILFVCLVVAVSLFITDLLTSARVASSTKNNEAEKATNIARIVAHSPVVIEALSGKRNQNEIQPYASEIRKLTNVDFVVVMDMKGIRKSHPDLKMIGKHFTGGDEGPALKGKEYTSFSIGTLGPSLRAFTPIWGTNGKQVGAVAVGISLENVDKAVMKSRMGIYLGTLCGALFGIIGAVVLARYLKKVLLGLEPFAIAKLLQERNAMLQSVREGIVAVDQDSKITLVNRAASRIFNKAGLNENPLGLTIENYLATTGLSNILKTQTAELDEEHNLNGITILVNRVPVIVGNQAVGAIATFRDKTEIQLLAEQLTGVRNYADALRAQAHEFMNKLHVILGMVHLEEYELLADYIKEIIGHQKNEIAFITQKIKDPVLAGFLIGKLSYARESGADLTITCGHPVPKPADSFITHELITMVGNLIDNAIEAVTDRLKKKISIEFDYGDDILTIEVKDAGTGMDQEQQNKIFQKGYSTKGNNRGLGLYLVSQTINKLEGEIMTTSKPGIGSVFSIYIPYKAEGGET